MHEAKAQSTFLDRCGIWISTLCAIHCLSLPVLVPLLPLVASSFFAEIWFERLILVSSLSMGAIAMTIGLLRHHGSAIPLILLSLGGVIYWYKDIFGPMGEPFTIFVGAMLLISGHTRNIKLMRQCRGCSTSGSDSKLSKKAESTNTACS